MKKINCSRRFALAAFAASLALAAVGGDFTWTGGGAAGNWNDADNWSPSTGTPGAGDKAVFSGATEVSITSGIALSDGTDRKSVV